MERSSQVPTTYAMEAQKFDHRPFHQWKGLHKYLLPTPWKLKNLKIKKKFEI